jgi:hypothetical protein
MPSSIGAKRSDSETTAIEAADLGGLNRNHSRWPADADQQRTQRQLPP